MPRASGASLHVRQEGMKEQHRVIRALLTTMSPRRAMEYIQLFQLPEEEAAVLIECDVHRRSYAQVGDLLHISPECIKKRRRRAYAKITDELEHR